MNNPKRKKPNTIRLGGWFFDRLFYFSPLQTLLLLWLVRNSSDSVSGNGDWDLAQGFRLSAFGFGMQWDGINAPGCNLGMRRDSALYLPFAFCLCLGLGCCFPRWDFFLFAASVVSFVKRRGGRMGNMTFSKEKIWHSAGGYTLEMGSFFFALKRLGGK